jgi:hypothetical protein
MLSGKPLGGMRCLGCDRPLAGLIDTSGPHIPRGLMPVSVASGAEAAAGLSAAPAKVWGGGGYALGRRLQEHRNTTAPALMHVARLLACLGACSCHLQPCPAAAVPTQPRTAVRERAP